MTRLDAGMDVIDELTAVLRRHVQDTNQMWATGEIAPDSAIRDVEPALAAVQWSPKFDAGVWRAESGAEWVEGTAEAGRQLAGQGCRWEMADLVVLPRGEGEAAASYRIVHHWGDPTRPPAQALFLETWRRGDDSRWRLARHAAEKV